MKVTMYFRIAIICIMSLAYLSSVNAQQTPDKVVKDFGEALSSLCETKNFAYREKIKALCFIYESGKTEALKLEIIYKKTAKQMPYCIQALLNKKALNEQQVTEILLWIQ